MCQDFFALLKKLTNIKLYVMLLKGLKYGTI